MFSSNYTSGVMSPGLSGALARAFGNNDNSGSKPTDDSNQGGIEWKKAGTYAPPSKMVCIDHLPAGMTAPPGVQIGNCRSYKPPSATAPPASGKEKKRKL